MTIFIGMRRRVSSGEVVGDGSHLGLGRGGQTAATKGSLQIGPLARRVHLVRRSEELREVVDAPLHSSTNRKCLAAKPVHGFFRRCLVPSICHGASLADEDHSRDSAREVSSTIRFSPLGTATRTKSLECHPTRLRTALGAAGLGALALAETDGRAVASDRVTIFSTTPVV